jgi:hypothetical protein
MNDVDFRRMMALLRTTWSAPPTMPDGAEASYRLMVGTLPTDTVMAGLARCAENESKWRPSPAELRKACTAGTRPRYATGDEAIALLQHAIRKVGCSHVDQRFPERHQAALDWLREQDESVAALAARHGLVGPGSLGSEPMADPEIGGAVRKRIALDHADVVAVAQQRVLAGGRAFVESHFRLKGTGPSGGMGELLGSLRPAAALEAGERAA